MSSQLCHDRSWCFLGINAIKSAILLLSVVLPALVHAVSVFDYPRSADFVVVEYTQSHEMLSNEDTTPLLRIFGDGRVVVHYPVYMKRAGDYEMRLSDAQLQALLSQLEQNQVLTFSPGRLVSRIRSLKQALIQSTGVVTERSDNTNTKINVYLENYVPATTGVAQSNFRQSINWKNLDWQAKSLPSVTELTNIANAEKILRGYLNNPALIKIK